MKKNIFAGLMAAVLVMAFVSGALAFGNMGPGQLADKSRHGFMKEKIAKEIGLTQEQKEKFLEKEQAMDRDLQGLKQENDKLRLWMRDEIKKDKTEINAVNSTIEKIGKNNIEIQKKRTGYILWMKSQLTKEQADKMRALFEQKRERQPGGQRGRNK